MPTSNPPSPTVAAIAAGLSGVTLPTALMQGELVKVALRAGSYTSYAVGSSAVSHVLQANQENRDGGNAVITMTVPPGTTQGCALQTVVYGKVIGVRFRSDINTPTQFSVVIDGVSYAVTNATYKWNGRIPATSTTTDGDTYRIIASDLTDGPHSVEVILASDPLGVTTYTLAFYGFVAERRVGYTERPGAQNIVAQGLLTGSLVAISAGSAPKNSTAVRRIIYTNTGTAGTVTLAYGGTTVWQAALAAVGTVGCSDSFDPGDYSVLSQYTHSGGTTIQYTVYGRS